MSCQVVFRNPVHQNGGCIFADPTKLIVLSEIEFGGRQFVTFTPVRELLQSQIPVDQVVLDYTQETETELVIDGKNYDLVAYKTPSEIIRDTPNVDLLVDEAVEKMGISRRKAKKELYNLIIAELNTAEELKRSVFDDDEEIIMILVATDDI